MMLADEPKKFSVEALAKQSWLSCKRLALHWLYTCHRALPNHPSGICRGWPIIFTTIPFTSSESAAQRTTLAAVSNGQELGLAQEYEALLLQTTCSAQCSLFNGLLEYFAILEPCPTIALAVLLSLHFHKTKPAAGQQWGILTCLWTAACINLLFNISKPPKTVWTLAANTQIPPKTY